MDAATDPSNKPIELWDAALIVDVIIGGLQEPVMQTNKVHP